MSGGTQQPPATMSVFGLAISPSVAMGLVSIPGSISTIDDGVLVFVPPTKECVEQVLSIMGTNLAILSGQFEDAEEPSQEAT